MSIEQGFRPQLLTDPAFRAIADAMPGYFAVTDALGGVVFCNRAYIEFCGGAMDDHLGHRWRKTVHPADHDRVDALSRAALATRTPIDFEARFRAADGTYRWLHSRASPYTGADGEFAGYVSVGADITAARTAAAERDRALGLLNAVDDAAPVGIAFVDSDLRLRRANVAFRRLLRLEGRPLLGLTPTEIGGAEWAEPIETILRTVLVRGQPIRDLEFRGRRRPDVGTFGNWLVNVFPVPGPGGAAGIGVVLQDVTELKQAEEGHRLSAARYRTLTDTLPQIVWSATPAGQLTYVNGRWREYSGRADSEAMGDGWIASLHGDDQAATLQRWRQSLASGEPYEAEFRIRRTDGLYRWHMVRALPVRDALGQVIEWAGTCTDVHGMRMSQARYRLLADSMPQMVGTAAPDGDFNYFNRWFHEYTGLGTMAIEGGAWTDVLHPEDRAGVRRAWRTALRAGQPFEGELRIRRHDAAYRWHLCRAVPIHDHTTGQVIAWFATAADIDDVRFERARYQTLAESLPELVWAASVDGRLTYGNRRLAEYTGASIEELVATGGTGAIHPDDSAAARAVYSAARTSGQPFEMECRLRRQDGEYRWHLARGVPMRDSAGEIAGWVGSASDIHDLRYERARYRTLSDTVSELIWSAGTDGRVTYGNARFWDYFGGSPKEWDDARWRDSLHPEDRDRVGELYREGLASRAPFEFEYRLRRHDGAHRWHVARCVPVFDASGDVTGWTGSASDIEAQKAAEERVAELNRELERRLADTETLLRVLPVGVGIADDSECREIRVNPALAQMLGVPPGQNVSLHDGGETPPYQMLRDGRAIPHEEFTLYRAANSGLPARDEYDVVTADGTTRRLLGYATPLMDANGDGGRVRGAVGAFVDLTEMKRAQDLLHQAQARYSAAGDAVPFGVWATDLHGATTYASDSFLRLLGKSLDDVRQSGWTDSLPPEQRAAHRRGWEAAFAAHEAWDTEMELLGADGEYHWVLSRALPAHDADGAFRGYAGINLDITGLKRIQDELARTVEDLRQANAVKDELLGLVSHELRTPLTAIIGNAQALRRHQKVIPPERAAAALQDIEDEGTRLHRLIENMLLLARVEGADDFEPEPVLLQRMLPVVAEALKGRLPGLSLELHLDPLLPAAAAQPGYIEQVVQNLVGNALKYGGGALPVEISAVLDGPWVRVSVEDRGSGITAEEASRVFTPFFRSERTATTASGVGLGLAVCKRLVEVQHGRIWAEPRAGGGTSVCFTLPLEDDSEE